MNPRSRARRSPGRCLALWLPLLLAGCTSMPATHMLLPGGGSPSREALPKAGAVVHVLTVTGDERDLQVQESTPVEISGTDTRAGPVRISMDDVAVAYFRNPARRAGPTQLAFPDANRLPRVESPGVIEARLSCPALDRQLERAEALHGYLRRSGFQPYTSGEQVARHAKNAALYVAATVVIVAACSAACGGMNFRESTTTAMPDKQDFRWALTSTDNRLEGLLSLKEKRACPARMSLDGQHSDRDLWSEFTSWKAGTATRAATLVRDRRTALFDLLGLKAVGTSTSAVHEASRTAE